ncbi:methyltransferase domain-containing protein [Lyngbya aestuarii]|uniref:methyltransferase domain-containing protein n=1 Tax=Lyngbya aestuarii TaxID=118322 RepID=UPI00403D7622
MQVWDKFRSEKLLEMRSSCDLVIDFGGSARQDSKLFAEKQYVTCDYDSSTKPDIVADICNLHMIADATYEGAICCAVLEHVYNPFLAVKEIFRILKDEAVLFGYVPFLYSYHAKPGHYQDYYRFTEDGVRYLLQEFESLEIVPVRGNLTTLLNFLPGGLNKLQNYLYWCDSFLSNKQVSGFNFYAKK